MRSFESGRARGLVKEGRAVAIQSGEQRESPLAGAPGYDLPLQRDVRTTRKGSVLVIVMVTLLFATFALVAFMERASVDLLVDQRDVLTRRMRMEAYSALEVTIAVLNVFRETGNGLRSAGEGWNDPLTFAGYTPGEGRVVEVAFEDESGKISLPHANAVVLTTLFKHWGITQADADGMADALLGWIKRNHTYSSAVQPDYESGPLPYLAPGRSMRSYNELAAIEKVREVLYDTDGRPNDLWYRFVDSVSLLDFQRSNINGAKADTLAAIGQYDEAQRQNLGEFMSGTAAYSSQGPGVIRTPADAQQIVGPTGNTGAFATTISALRVVITVRDGRTEFKLAAVIAPQGGATTVQTTATAARTQTSAAEAQTTAKQQARPDAGAGGPRPPGGSQPGGPQNQGTNRNLRYPFTLLDIRENNEIPPPPPPVSSTG
jgi:hypothetical protein